MSLVPELVADFWQFILDNQDELTYENYADYYQNNVENIYSEISNKIKTLNPGLDIDQNVKIVPTSANSFNKVSIFTITCLGNINNMGIVEELYQASKNYNFGKYFMVTKYLPETFIIPYIKFYTNFLDVENFQYMVNIDNNGLDLIIVLNDTVHELIKTEADINEVRNGCFGYLSLVFGEYIMMKFLKRVTVIPKTLYLQNYEETTLTKLSSPLFKNTISAYTQLAEPEQRCVSCKTNGFNVDLKPFETKFICDTCSSS